MEDSNLYSQLAIAGLFSIALLSVKAIWGRYIMRRSIAAPADESLQVYMRHAVVRSLLLLALTILIIKMGWVDTVYFLIIFIGGYFFVQIYEIKYLIGVERRQKRNANT
jgi:hypothetical protein